MLNWIANRQLDKFESEWNYDVSYMREAFARSGMEPLKLIGAATKMGSLPSDMPADVSFAAKIAAVLSEDCGPCTQLTVKMAERAGVDAGTLRAVVEGRDDALSPDVRTAVQFVRATVAHDPAADPLREKIEARWGKRAIVALAYAIAAARVYPTIKYAMGYGRACTRLQIGSTTVVPAEAAVL